MSKHDERRKEADALVHDAIKSMVRSQGAQENREWRKARDNEDQMHRRAQGANFLVPPRRGKK